VSATVSRRAVGATAAFALAGVAGLVLAPQPWAIKAPHAVFYAVLVLNTYFSIRFFESLQPKERDERAIDSTLVVLYLALAASMGAPLAFALVAVLLFAAATAKYVLLLPVMDRRDILIRKILIDGLGLALCLAMLLGTLLADPWWTAWAAAIIFAVANLYLLAIRPMYADPRQPIGAAKERGAANRASSNLDLPLG
jgi:hypothetical protein